MIQFEIKHWFTLIQLAIKSEVEYKWLEYYTLMKFTLLYDFLSHHLSVDFLIFKIGLNTASAIVPSDFPTRLFWSPEEDGSLDFNGIDELNCAPGFHEKFLTWSGTLLEDDVLIPKLFVDCFWIPLAWFNFGILENALGMW